MKKTFFCLIALAIAAAFYFYRHEIYSELIKKEPVFQISSPNGISESISDAEISQKDLSRKLVTRLVKSRWSKKAAKAVITLNLDRYLQEIEVEPHSIDAEIEGFESLHPDGYVTDLLESHPKMAGALELVDDPETLAKGILQGDGFEEQELLADSCCPFITRSDLSSWAKALERHGRCIAELLRRKQPLAQSAFLFPDEDEFVTEEYGKWLAQVLDPKALPMNDEELCSLLEFIAEAGPEIRRRMKESYDFRQKFNNEIWPAFERCLRRSWDTSKGFLRWDCFAENTHLWDLLIRKDGEALFQRSGLLAVDLLYGSNAVSPELREKVAQLLLLGNQEIVENVFSKPWSNHSLFCHLVLKRNLSNEQILVVCSKLLNNNDPEHLLANWNNISDDALREDIGPPPSGLLSIIPGYSAYYACKKKIQGRELEGGDYFGMAFDVVDLATLGTCKWGVSAGKAATTATMKAKLRQEAVEDIVKLTSRELAEHASEKAITAMVAHHSMRILPATLKQTLLKSSVLDITEITKVSFNAMSHLGFGRESYKMLTGLEARIFMRNDAKVFISLPSAIAGKNSFARFLNLTAVNASFTSPPAQYAIQKTIEAATEEKKHLDQNIACWWAGLATGVFKPQNQ